MVSFSGSLRRQADGIFESIYAHPFVQGIANGSLPSSALIHYVRQDTEYLSTYCKVCGMAIAKSLTHRQMLVFHKRIALVLGGEQIPHENFCRVAGVPYTDVIARRTDLAPTAHHYARHVLSVAQQGTLGEIVAVLLPCHWVYLDLAKRMLDKHKPTPDHPFYDWITFYSRTEMQHGLAELTEMLDELAESAGELDYYMMTSAFLDSFRLEYQFFDMAYRLERWTPIGITGGASVIGGNAYA
ncbi:thiaminase II [Alicyclobacillus sp. ALC3]|uniref:thiaminase II n=1 Tax=Alicyclobacillus sp. ALC3 TaxID=2796143 RepID=UPI002379FED7|nr:thiaminase II [Alicyclobacillus sp. ALC3]WDL95826.1 thiaminase II [Alicyclobacillus sp. ALC3]